MADIQVTGLKELQQFLDTLPAKLEANVMRGALRAGIKVVSDQVKANVPVGGPSARNARLYGGYAGALRDSIRIGTRSKGGTVTAYVKAGGKTKSGADVYYAHMIEFTGAMAHLIKAKKAKYLLLAGGHPVAQVEHPGFKAKPFMRPALDGQAQNAVITAAEYMKKRLATKEGLDTADIVIGDEA